MADATHVVMPVANGFTADARVAKTASSLRRAGMRVTVVACHTPTAPANETLADGVEVIRVKPVMLTNKWKNERIAAKLARLRHLLEYRDEERFRVTVHHRKILERAIAVDIVVRKRRLRELSRTPSDALAIRVLWRLRREYLAVTIELRRRQLGWRRRIESVRRPQSVSGRRSTRWIDRVPDVVDFDAAMGPAIESLDPDFIHAHDFHVMLAAARSSLLSRSAWDSATPWIYDAHEYVAGLTHLSAERREALTHMEHDLIQRAAAVITVSPQLADKLQADHHLNDTPVVVLNAPSRERRGGPTIRDLLPIDPSTPLAVYSGRLDPKRGVLTLVEALAHLDDVHIALVAQPSSKAARDLLRNLLDRAKLLGAQDRLHVVPYVPHQNVSNYLSGADVGVHPMSRYPNGEVALPNKLFEYLHARLPLAVSDCSAQAEFVKQHRVGQVFQAGNPVDLAHQLERVLQNRSRFRSHITDEFLHEYSWERQEERLLAIYDRIG